MFYFPCLLGPLARMFLSLFPSILFMSRSNVYEPCLLIILQIPDKVLEHRPRGARTARDSESSSPQSRPSDDESVNYIIHDPSQKGENGRPGPRPRRLSVYEDGEAVMDSERGKTRTSSTTSSTSRP